MMKQSVVELKEVSFAYQDFLVLNKVSFSINEGEFVGIIGPNGGGKTTLLKIILGFLKPLSGSIKVFGVLPADALERVSYVPQSVRFDKQFPISVLEVVLMGRLSHLPWYGKYARADKEAALNTLEKVGLADLKDRAFGTLSGGQAQRTLIARALVSNPGLLLLDEPTASVDAQAQTEIYSILKGLRGSMTILMVTHDLGVAVDHVEKVICVQQKVVTLNPQEVCEHFAIGLYHPPLINTFKERKRDDTGIF